MGITSRLTRLPVASVAMIMHGPANQTQYHLHWSKTRHSIENADSKMSGGKKMLRIRCASK